MQNKELIFRYYDIDNPLLSCDGFFFEAISKKINSISSVKDTAAYFKDNNLSDKSLQEYNQIDFLSNSKIEGNLMSGIITTFNVLNSIDLLDDKKFNEKHLKLEKIISNEIPDKISYSSHYYFAISQKDNTVLLTLPRKYKKRFTDFFYNFAPESSLSIFPQIRNLKNLKLSDIKKIIITDEIFNETEEKNSISFRQKIKKAFAPDLTEDILQNFKAKIELTVPRGQERNEKYFYQFIEQFENIILKTSFGTVKNNNKELFVEKQSNYNDKIENEEKILDELLEILK